MRHPSDLIKERWPILLLVVWVFVSLVPMSGVGEIFQVSEGREGVVVREILDYGEIVLPKRNGEIVPSKPVFFHWISAAASILCGGLSEFTLRMPSVLGALLTLCFLFWYLNRRVGELAAIIGVLILSSSYGFIRLAQDGRVDMLFSTFVVGAILVFLDGFGQAIDNGEGSRSIKKKVWWGVSILCGLAVLAKGPLGIVLPGIVIGAVLFWIEGIKGWKAFIQPAWIVAVLIPLPWYLAATEVGSSDFIGRQLFFENVARFIGGEGITKKPVYFYLPHILSQPAPWSILFIVYIVFLLRDFIRLKRGLIQRNSYLPQNRAERYVVVTALVWLVVALVFLSVSSGKRRGYLLPLLPAIALVLGARIASTWRDLRDRGLFSRPDWLFQYSIFTWGVLVWLVVSVLLMVCYLCAGNGLQPIFGFWPRLIVFLQSVEIAIARSHGVIPSLVTGLSVVTIALWVYGFRRRQVTAAALAVVMFVQFVQISVIGTLQAVKGVTHGYRDFAQLVAKEVPADTKINFVKRARDESFDGFFFYFGRHVSLVDPSKQILRPGIYLARDSWVKERAVKLRGNIKEITRGGRRVDTSDKELVLFELK